MGNDEFDEILSALDRETARIRVRAEPRRYNKPATVIGGFPPGVDLVETTRSLKNRLATGGSVVDGEVYLQG
ncbi:MAG: stress response translation initiation inhibitor YciH, partial [Thermoplasmata archaeon]